MPMTKWGKKPKKKKGQKAVTRAYTLYVPIIGHFREGRTMEPVKRSVVGRGWGNRRNRQTMGDF